MNAHGRRPLDPEAAERLLSGHPVARRASRRLAERLSAASAAPLPGELAGEHAAVAAFLSAPDVDLALQPGRPSMIKSAVVAKLLTLKAAAIAVAAVSAGGVALAASTGVLPLNQAPGNPGHSVPASDHPNGSNATPSPSLIGLCTAFLAGAGEDHGKALKNPAFSALITAAGDRENVESFCAELGVTEPGADRGSASPTDHPTGKPSDVGPTHLPTTPPSHPTGPPTTH